MSKDSLFDDDNIEEPRMRRFIKEGAGIGESYASTGSAAKAVSSLLNKPKVDKKSYGYYLDDKIDVFFSKFAKITKYSKSEVVNQLVTLLISESDIMKEMSSQNEAIQKIVDEFNK